MKDRLSPLSIALRRRIPGSDAWISVRLPEGGCAASIQVPAPETAPDRHLVIHLRPDGDLQVEFHIPKRRGSPFEQLIVIPDEAFEEALDEAVAFVSRLLKEDLVLAWDSRLLGGGRRF